MPGRSMMRFVWVGLGGAIGSMVRYAVGLAVDQTHFPWATLGITLSGVFILATFLTLSLGHLSVAVITPIAVGVLGRLHDLFDVRWEGFTIRRNGRPEVAFIYVTVSVVGGFVAAWGGYSLGRAFR
jgi:fluoride exporter